MISKIKLKGCDVLLPGIGQRCGDWNLKHNEYYYCNECGANIEQC